VAAAVDPSRVPCPADRYRGERTTYNCAPREQVPPPSDSDFLAIDDGNASCRFVRSTLYAIPSTADALKKSCLPFSLVVTPLARPQPGERLVPLADYANEAGPLRCSRCMAYACHAVTWSGRSFLCPVCEASTAVPDHLFSALLPNGRRMDAENRPEFYAGSVDLLVSNLFRHNERKSALPLANVYLIDVSFNAQKTGVMHTMIAAVRSVIEHLDETQNHHVC
jgi:protein transport protein SEC24